MAKIQPPQAREGPAANVLLQRQAGHGEVARLQADQPARVQLPQAGQNLVARRVQVVQDEMLEALKDSDRREVGHGQLGEVEAGELAQTAADEPAGLLEAGEDPAAVGEAHDGEVGEGGGQAVETLLGDGAAGREVDGGQVQTLHSAQHLLIILI